MFCEFESSVYAPEGTEEFKRCLNDDAYLSGIRYYGAFDADKLVGVLGIREEKCHVCFFFVEGEYQRLGIGRKLFRRMQKDFPARTITLNSSPYGLPFYKVLGFTATGSEKTVNGIPFRAIQLQSKAVAQNAPTPITTYALFCDGKYLTNEQMNEARFIKLLQH